MALPPGFVLETDLTRPTNIPTGFELEAPLETPVTPTKPINLPLGFELEAKPPSIKGLGIRGLKQFANILPETAKETLYGLGGGKIASFVTAGLLNRRLKKMGIKAPSLRDTQKLVKQSVLKRTGIPEFEVIPPTTVGEKAVDITTGIGKFVTKLAVLRKVMPGASEAALWEMENVSSGGIPGLGYATHSAFSLPSVFIKGKALPLKAGRLIAESFSLAGLSALEQKIDTGEIDPVQIGIAAGIPAALRTPKAIKGLIRKRNPKVMKAIAEEYPETLGKLPEQIKRLKATQKALPQASKWRSAWGTPPTRIGEKDILQATKTWAKRTEVLTEAERTELIRSVRRQKYVLLRKSGLSSEKAEKIAWDEGTEFASELSSIKLRPLVLTDAQKNSFDTEILRAYTHESPTKRAGAIAAMLKMQDGKIPTTYEFGLLAPVLGEGTTEKIFNSLKGKIPYEGRDTPRLIRDGLKAMRFGFDPQTARGLSKTAWRHPEIYFPSIWKNIRAIVDKKYSDRIAAEIKAGETYKLGRDKYKVNYLDMRPWASVEAGTKLQQYGDFADSLLDSKDEILRFVGKWLRASERGANLGMNYGMNKLVEKAHRDFLRYQAKRVRIGKPLSSEAEVAWQKQRGNIINAFSKRVIAKHPKMKEIQQAANWVVFSPAYAVSGPTADIGSVLRIATGKGPNRHYGMQMILSQVAGLTFVSSMAAYAGYKKFANDPTKAPSIDGSWNPLNPLWGKIRQENNVYDLSFGDVGPYRLLARVGLSAYMYTQGKLTDKQITTFRGKKIIPAGEAFHRHLSTKRTLWLGVANQLLTKKDWLGRPTDLKGTALENLPFEFLTAFVEAGEADGLWEDMANGVEFDEVKKSLLNLPTSVAALGGIGTMSYPVHSTTLRMRYQNYIADVAHDKEWDELSISERKKLKGDNREKFEQFAEQIRKERVEVPFSEERMQREKTEANRRVSKMLSKENRRLVKGIDLDIGRNPKKTYLNDERYNRYQKLTAQYLDERLSEVDITGIEDKWRVKRIQAIIRGAKNRAFVTLREEMEELRDIEGLPLDEKEKANRRFMAAFRIEEATAEKKRYAEYYKKVGPKRAMTYAKWLEKSKKPTY